MPLYALYAELGRCPLEITMKTRTIGFWNRLILDKDCKISRMMYLTLRIINNSGFRWLSCVKSILTGVVRNDVWILQDRLNTFSLNLSIKAILIDQFLPNWRSNLGNSTKGRNYNILKDNISLDYYFKILQKNL